MKVILLACLAAMKLTCLPAVKPALLAAIKWLFRAALIGPRYIVIAYQLWVAFVLIVDSARLHHLVGMNEIDQKFEEILLSIIAKLERTLGK
jgi:hypothetical protein